MEKREKFSSRLGFILISAGCAIGLGNVWRFPYITGQYGGGLFVLIYLFFLIAMGLPLAIMEFATGRASQRSIATSFEVLEPKGSKWHLYGYLAMAGNYLLMMFYTVVTGWMLQYFVKMANGSFTGLNAKAVAGCFDEMLADPVSLTIYMAIVVIAGFAVNSFGVQKGVERITKVMMIALLVIMVVLAINSIFTEGGD